MFLIWSTTVNYGKPNRLRLLMLGAFILLKVRHSNWHIYITNKEIMERHMVFIIKGWHLEKNELKKLQFVTPEGIRVEMVRAVRTSLQIDGAAQELLLSPATTVENLVDLHQTMQSAFNGHSKDIQRVGSVGNELGLFVESIHQVVESHSSALHGVPSKMDEYEQHLQHPQKGIQGHEHDIQNSRDKFRSQLGGIRGDATNLYVSRDSLQSILKEEGVYFESSLSRLQDLFHRNLKSHVATFGQRIEEVETRCLHEIPNLRPEMTTACGETVSAKLLCQELTECSPKIEGFTQQFAQDMCGIRY